MNINSSKSICDDFLHLNCIEYTNVQDKFSNNAYLNQHKIHPSRFTYKSTGDNSKYPLSNAFESSDRTTYWASSTPNNDTFHNSITVEFFDPVKIEKLFYSPSISTQNSTNIQIFNGAPTKLKIYASINNKEFRLVSLFVGTPYKDWTQFQFILPNAILCDKIKLEFIEVTKDLLTSNGTHTPVACGITFIQALSNDDQKQISTKFYDNKKHKRNIKNVPSSGICGNNLTFVYNSTTKSLTIQGTGPMTNYSNLNSIFYYSDIATVEIKSGVTSIGAYAFEQCKQLSNVTLPDGLTSIYTRGFFGCSTLFAISLPESLTYIGSRSFQSCDALVDITIPESVTYIGSNAFSMCSGLVNVNLNYGLKTIKEYAFEYCRYLDSITIPESVETIEAAAFSYCSRLTSATIPESVTSIGSSMFMFCSSLINVNLPNNMKVIKFCMFEYCKSLKTIKIPESVETIDTYGFLECCNLTTIIIPDNVTTINVSAFKSCISLVNITIPDKVTIIKSYTFYDCTSLSNIGCSA